MASGTETQVYSLIGDIGGTNARFQLITFSADSKEPTEVKSHFYKAKEFPSVKEIITDFLSEFKGTEKYPQNAAIGVAGAVFEGKCLITNLPWPTMEEKDLEKEFNIKPVALINDFVAIGYSMKKIKPEEIVTLHEAKPTESGASIVAGPGTGMGECILQPFVDSHGKSGIQVLPTEGGHKNFSPTTETEWEYMNYVLKECPELKEKIGYLSTERSFCGPAIPNMYTFFCQKHGVTPDEDLEYSSEKIMKKGLAKEDKTCVAVLEFFTALYAKEISNFALSAMPYRGIYLVGGLTSSLIEYLTKDASKPFISNFLSKGKVVNAVLNNFPIYIVKQEELGLLGAFVKAQIDAYRL
jgi:glucokinase